jgi:hypothetical protein
MRAASACSSCVRIPQHSSQTSIARGRSRSPASTSHSASARSRRPRRGSDASAHSNPLKRQLLSLSVCPSSTAMAADQLRERVVASSTLRAWRLACNQRTYAFAAAGHHFARRRAAFTMDVWHAMAIRSAAADVAAVRAARTCRRAAQQQRVLVAWRRGVLMCKHRLYTFLLARARHSARVQRATLLAWATVTREAKAFAVHLAHAANMYRARLCCVSLLALQAHASRRRCRRDVLVTAVKARTRRQVRAWQGTAAAAAALRARVAIAVSRWVRAHLGRCLRRWMYATRLAHLNAHRVAYMHAVHDRAAAGRCWRRWRWFSAARGLLRRVFAAAEARWATWLEGQHHEEFCLLRSSLSQWAATMFEQRKCRHKAWQLEVATSAHRTRTRVRAFHAWGEEARVSAQSRYRRQWVQLLLQLWVRHARAVSRRAGSRWRTRQKIRMHGYVNEVRLLLPRCNARQASFLFLLSHTNSILATSSDTTGGRKPRTENRLEIV